MKFNFLLLWWVAFPAIAILIMAANAAPFSQLITRITQPALMLKKKVLSTFCHSEKSLFYH